MEDGADRHVERWRDHWAIDEPFDDDVEAFTYRVVALHGWFKSTTRTALATLGLQDFEYDTLHALMIRDTPGIASPGALAEDLRLSNAGMTGRLEGLERKGWLHRRPGEGDRRTVVVEISKPGMAIWRQAMNLRGDAEDETAAVLTPRELSTLNRLLKKMTLHIEQQQADQRG